MLEELVRRMNHELYQNPIPIRWKNSTLKYWNWGLKGQRSKCTARKGDSKWLWRFGSAPNLLQKLCTKIYTATQSNINLGLVYDERARTSSVHLKIIDNWSIFNFQETKNDYERNKNWWSSSKLRNLIMKLSGSRYKRWGIQKIKILKSHSLESKYVKW